MQGQGDPELFREAAADLVLNLCTQRRTVTTDEASQLRQHFGERVLPRQVSPYVARKYRTHVESNEEWPEDTSPEEYLESLRAVVLHEQNGIFLEYSEEDGDWTIYFVGHVRRQWRGPSSGGRIVVIFNADRSL